MKEKNIFIKIFIGVFVLLMIGIGIYLSEAGFADSEQKEYQFGFITSSDKNSIFIECTRVKGGPTYVKEAFKERGGVILDNHKRFKVGAEFLQGIYSDKIGDKYTLVTGDKIINMVTDSFYYEEAGVDDRIIARFVPLKNNNSIDFVKNKVVILRQPHPTIKKGIKISNFFK